MDAVRIIDIWPDADAMTKIVAINGSPRKKWNTAQAIDKAAEGLRDSGFEVEATSMITHSKAARAGTQDRQEGQAGLLEPIPKTALRDTAGKGGGEMPAP